MGDMFNNDVTYNDKWETPENLKALDTVEKKYFHRSVCYPSCPTAWAPEVLEMLDYLDKEFGIAYNTESIMAYATKGKWYYLLTVKPFANLFSSIRYNFLKFKFKDEWDREYYKKKTLTKRFKSVGESFLHSYAYGRNVFRVQVIAPIVNRIRKPKINMRQMKEKYGRLELYFQSPDYLEQHIEYMLAKCKLKLALKGAYYPVDSMYNSGWSYNVGDQYRVDDVEITVEPDGTKNRTDYHYRKAMKDLGLDLKEMEQKALALEKAQDDDAKRQKAEEEDAANKQVAT